MTTRNHPNRQPFAGLILCRGQRAEGRLQKFGRGGGGDVRCAPNYRCPWASLKVQKAARISRGQNWRHRLSSPDAYGGRLGFFCKQHPDTNLIEASEQILTDLDRGI
jgi:hypothetical protein